LRFALLGLALGVGGYVSAAFTQDSGAPAGFNGTSTMQHRAPDPQKQAARLAKRLELDDDQTAKITAILQNRQQQLAAVRNDGSLAPQDRRAKLRAIQHDTDTQINALLTPDQQTQYATLKQNMKERRQHAHGAPNASGSTDEGSDSNSH
jgi:Spy/CpxP family protein refolding chaperone